jgi:hypothetical protein
MPSETVDLGDGVTAEIHGSGDVALYHRGGAVALLMASHARALYAELHKRFGSTKVDPAFTVEPMSNLAANSAAPPQSGVFDVEAEARRLALLFAETQSSVGPMTRTFETSLRRALDSGRREGREEAVRVAEKSAWALGGSRVGEGAKAVLDALKAMQEGK